MRIRLLLRLVGVLLVGASLPAVCDAIGRAVQLLNRDEFRTPITMSVIRRVFANVTLRAAADGLMWYGVWVAAMCLGLALLLGVTRPFERMLERRLSRA